MTTKPRTKKKADTVAGRMKEFAEKTCFVDPPVSVGDPDISEFGHEIRDLAYAGSDQYAIDICSNYRIYSEEL